MLAIEPALGSSGTTIVVDASDTTDGPPTVVLSDGPDPAQFVPEPYHPLLAGGRIGVVSVGGRIAGDVALPTSATAGEVCLACRLLAQIVRLRRKCQTESHQKQVLRHLASSDPVTGIPNRRAWDEALQRRVNLAGDGPGPCLALLDLDHFKQVNDRFGHAVGDRVLTAFARALAANVRDDDFTARLGGDEFGLLLGRIAPESAHRVVDRIRAQAGHAVAEAGLPAITASAGFLPPAVPTEKDSEVLYAAGSEALRRAKNDGRNRTVAFTPQWCKNATS